jgi:hypothetical protein
MGISVALRGNDGDRRIELQDGHGPAFKQETAKCLPENVIAAKGFRREDNLTPALFVMPDYTVAATR